MSGCDPTVAGVDPALLTGAAFQFGAEAMIGSPTTRFLVPGNEDSAPVVLRELCVGRNLSIAWLCIEVDGPAASATILTYTVMVNTIATTILVAIAASATQGLATGFPILPMGPGDTLGLRVTKSGAHPPLSGITGLVGYV